MTKFNSSPGTSKLIVHMIVGLIISGAVGSLFILLEQLLPFSKEAYWTGVWVISLIGGGFLSAAVSFNVSTLFGDALYDGLIVSVVLGTVGAGWQGILASLFIAGLFLTFKNRHSFLTAHSQGDHKPPLDDLTYGRALANSLRHSAVIEYNAGQFEGLLLRALKIIQRRKLRQLMDKHPEDVVDLMLEDR